MLSSRDLRKQLQLLSESNIKLVESLTSIISSCKASLGSQIFEESEKRSISSILFDSHDGILSKAALLDKVSDSEPSAAGYIKHCRNECIKILTLALDQLPPLDDVPHSRFVSYCLEHLDSEDNYVRESILHSFSAVLIKAPGCFRSRDSIGKVLFERCNLLYSMQSFKSTPAIRGLCLKVLAQTILRFCSTRSRAPQLRSHVKGLFDETHARGIDSRHKTRFIGALDALAYSAPLLDTSEPFRREALGILAKQLDTECSNEDNSRYDLMKSILNCVFRQSKWFGCLLLQREASILIDKHLVALCSHKNVEVRSIAFRAQESFISEFSVQLACSAAPDRLLLNLIVNRHVESLRSRESTRQTCLSLRSLGHLANAVSNAVKGSDAEDVKGIAQLFLDNGSLYLNSNIMGSDDATIVPSLLFAFAQLLPCVPSVDPSSRLFITKCSIMTMTLFPAAHPRLRNVFIRSLHFALITIAQHSDGLKHLIDDIMFHGLLSFISATSNDRITAHSSLEATQAMMLSSLVSSCRVQVDMEDDLPNDADLDIDDSRHEEVIKDYIRDAVMRQMLRIFEELSIGYKPVPVTGRDEDELIDRGDAESDDDLALFGQENSLFTREGVAPTCSEDMSKFIRLSDLLGAALPVFPSSCLQKWLPSWIDIVCSRIASYPLVATLYSLLKHIFVTCQPEVLSSHEESKHVILSLQLAATEIFERCIQFRDHLFKTALICLLNAPAVALSCDVAVKVLSRGLAMGLSDPNIATSAMQSLSSWWQAMPEWAPSLSLLLTQVQFYITPSDSKIFSPEDVSSAVARKMKTKDPKKYELKLKKKIAVEQCDTQVAQLAISTIGKFGPSAAHVLMRGRAEDNFEHLHVAEWALCEVEIPALEPGADAVVVNLDSVAPRAAFLASNGATRQIRAHGAELFHAICSVLVANLKSNTLDRHAKMIPRYLKVCLKLASDSEEVCHKLFQPLVRQIVNFCSGSSHSHTLLPRILDVLFQVVVSAEDAGQRQTSSDVIAEFIGNASKVYDVSCCDVSTLELGLRRVKAMLESPSASQRLSACEIVNNKSFYVPFREHPRQTSASVFCFYMIEGCLKCLKLACRDDPVLDSFTAANLALHRFERLLSNPFLLKEIQVPHARRLGPPNIVWAQFLSQYSSDICSTEKRYRDKIIRFFQKYGGSSSHMRSACFNQGIVSSCFQHLGQVLSGVSPALDIRGFHSLCGSICAFFDAFQYFHSCDATIALNSADAVFDALVSSINFITVHSRVVLVERVARESPRLLRSVKVQLSFVVYCSSKFLASHSFARENPGFLCASLRLCSSALLRPEFLGLSISGGRTLKVDTPKQIILASKASQSVSQHLNSEIVSLLKQSQHLFEGSNVLSKPLSDLLLGISLLDPASSIMHQFIEPSQAQNILHQILGLEFSCSPRIISWSGIIVSSLSRCSKFSEYIINCICQVGCEGVGASSSSGSLFFQRFSLRLGQFIVDNSKTCYSSLANMLSVFDLKQAASALELINHTLVAVSRITSLDSSPNFSFLQDVIRPLHLKVKALSTSDSKMQHLCSRFVQRVFQLHPTLCDQISHEMSSLLFDILLSILHSPKPEKSVLNDIISSVFPYFLSADSPLNAAVREFLLGCFNRFGSLKAIQELPPDNLGRVDAHTTIMSIFDCVANSRWHGIIESVYCVYMENVALCEKLNLALSFLLSNLPASELVLVHSCFMRLVSSRQFKSATQQYLRLQLCKNLWPLILSASADNMTAASEIHSSAWSFIGPTFQSINNFKDREISSVEVAVDWLCSFQMLEAAYRQLPKEKLFFRPPEMEHKKYSLEIMKSLAKARRDIIVAPNVQLRFLPSLSRDVLLSSHNAFLAYICCTQSSEDVFNKNIFRFSNSLLKSLLNDLDTKFKVEIRFEVHKASLLSLQSRTSFLQSRPQALKIHFSDASSMILDSAVVSSQSMVEHSTQPEIPQATSDQSSHHADLYSGVEMDSFAQTGVLIPMLSALDTASRVFQEYYANLASHDDEYANSWIADWVRTMANQSEDPRIRLFFAKVIILRPKFFEAYKHKKDFCAALCCCCELAAQHFHPDECTGPSFNYFVRDLCALLGDWYVAPISPEDKESFSTAAAEAQKVQLVHFESLQGLINDLIPACIFPKASIWKSNIGFIEVFARICSGHWRVNFDCIVQSIALLSRSASSKRMGETFSSFDASIMTFIHVIDLSLQYASPASLCSPSCALHFISVFEKFLDPQNEYNLSRKLREALFELASIIHHKLPNLDPRDSRSSIFATAPQLFEISRRSLLHYSNSGRDDHFLCYLRKAASFCPDLLLSFRAQASALVTKVQGELRYYILEVFRDYFKSAVCSTGDRADVLREIIPHVKFLLNSLDSKAQLLVFELVQAALTSMTVSSSTEHFVLQLRSWLLSIIFENSCHVISKKPRLKLLEVLALAYSSETCSSSELEVIKLTFKLDIGSPHAQVQAAARQFWGDLCQSQKMSERLEICVNHMFHPENCSSWLSSTVALLMQCMQDDATVCITNKLRIKLQSAELKSFPSLSSEARDLMSNSKFLACSSGADHSSSVHRSSHQPVNFYTMTQGDGPILTQLNASQQGMENLDGSSMNTMDILESTTESFVSVLKKPRAGFSSGKPKFPMRFQGSDPEEARKIAIRLAQKQSESLFQSVEDAKRTASEPEMLRKYRQDDTPDSELSLADVMKPLVASCLADDGIASIMFLTLMKHQCSNSALRGKKRVQELCLFHSLQDSSCLASVRSILASATSRESALIGCLLNCFLEHQSFCLSAESVVRASIRCGVVRAAIAYLEGSIVQSLGSAKASSGLSAPLKKSDSFHERSTGDDWGGLVQLYEHISDEDSLLAAYDMLEQLSEAKQAFANEASGFYEAALQFYELHSNSAQSHLHRGYMNCLQSLGRWEEAAVEIQKNTCSSSRGSDHHQAALSSLLRADSANLTLHSTVSLPQATQYALELERADIGLWQMIRDDAAVALLNFECKELAHTKFRVQEALGASSKYVQQLVSCEPSKGNEVLSQIFRLIQVLEAAELLSSSRAPDQLLGTLKNKWTRRLQNATCDFRFFSDIIASSRYLFFKLRGLRPGLGSQCIQALSSFLSDVSLHVLNLGHFQYGTSLVREALCLVKEQGLLPPADLLLNYANAVTRVEFMQRSSKASGSSASALATVAQIKNCLSEFSHQGSWHYDLAVQLILFRHLEALVTSGIANEEEQHVLIHSAYHDLAPSLQGIAELPNGLSKNDLSSTHEAIIGWLSTQLSSSSGNDPNNSRQHRDQFISQVVLSVSEIIRHRGDSAASYIPLAVQLTIEACTDNHTSVCSAVFRQCAPSFLSGCSKWLPQVLAEYQSALLRNCRPVCEALEGLLFSICSINPQAVFFAVSCALESALVFLLGPQFRIVCDGLSALLNRIPSVLFYKRFVAELQSMVDPDQLWSSVSKICQEMFNSNMQEQSLQYLNKHLERWNSVHYWKSQSCCRKYDSVLQKISFPVNFSTFASAQSLLRSLKDAFQAPKTNAQGVSDLSAYSAFLSEFDGLRCPQKIVEFSTMCDDLDSQLEIFRFKPDIWIARSKTKPKKFSVLASNGVEYSYLCKGTEDLRQDQRVSQLFSISQRIMDRNAVCRSKRLKINYYSVHPLTIDFGVVEWMASAASLASVIKSGFPISRGDPSKVLEQCVSAYMSTVLENKTQHAEMLAAAVSKSLSGEIRTKMEKISTMIPQDALRRGMLSAASSIMTFHHFRHEFSRTVAASSAVQWILGVGDRHAENNLLSTTSGCLLPIDFGIAFGDGVSRLPIPELMPFRLSPQMQFVFAPLQAKYILRRRMAAVFSALREKSSEILSLCEVFVKDRLLNIASLGNSRDSFEEEGALLDNMRHDLSALQLSLTQRPSLQKYVAMKAKLQCAHPGDQIVELLNSNTHLEKQTAIKNKLVQVLQPYCREVAPPLSPLDCSDMLLDMAMDFRLTGIAFRGWQAWL